MPANLYEHLQRVSLKRLNKPSMQIDITHSLCLYNCHMLFLLPAACKRLSYQFVPSWFLLSFLSSGPLLGFDLLCIEQRRMGFKMTVQETTQHDSSLVQSGSRHSTLSSPLQSAANSLVNPHLCTAWFHFSHTGVYSLVCHGGSFGQ